ncbi:MAG: hypothetical protein AB4042_22010 [Leptolyngbyaceae cyanobacterium]
MIEMMGANGDRDSGLRPHLRRSRAASFELQQQYRYKIHDSYNPM